MVEAGNSLRGATLATLAWSCRLCFSSSSTSLPTRRTRSACASPVYSASCMQRLRSEL